MIRRILFSAFLSLGSATMLQAQLSSNSDKFLGNITTSYQIDYGNEKFYKLWNQITPENESKWDQIEGQKRGTFSWNNVRNIYNYAKGHSFPFKFHTLVWGSQYPKWMDNLSKEEQLAAITEWMDAIKKQFPSLDMIDVVNEAVEGHAPAPYKEALGGNGVTGYDWIIKAFEMAYERWPNAILIYNDYNTFQWNTDQFINLVRTLRDAGAPIDAYGCQSHDLTGCSASTLKASMKKIQDALKIPMYITEYDIATADDQAQLNDYKNQLPLLWEADYCAGVTLWGYIYGKTWTTDGNSGLIRNGEDRPAMTWLREYMQSEKAKTAKSPYPGMKKEASLYVQPASIRPIVDEPLTVNVRVKLRTKKIDNVALYAGTKLLGTLTEAPFEFTYTPTATGYTTFKAVVTATDGSQYERLSRVNARIGGSLVPGTAYTSVSSIVGKKLALVRTDTERALYGINDQNLGYDTYDMAFQEKNTGYLFKTEAVTVNSKKYYRLRLITPLDEECSIWGSPGYLNTQVVTGTCSFILGLNNQNGQDLTNGALWDIQYVADKGFTLKNVGTGKYLHDNTPAKYDDPVYFSFCTLKTTTGVTSLQTSPRRETDAVYSLQGVKMGTMEGWTELPRGLYIVNGKKIYKP